ncbi:MAG: hypothetical protein U0163_16950 [Gemmatimonadaceae bacterium]
MRAVSARLPTANELAYDYSHSFVIGYSPTARYRCDHRDLRRAGGVFLYFAKSARPKLHDPKRVLMGLKAGLASSN